MRCFIFQKIDQENWLLQTLKSKGPSIKFQNIEMQTITPLKVFNQLTSWPDHQIAKY